VRRGGAPGRRAGRAGDADGGAVLAAAVTLLAREAGEPAIDLQVLVHPAVQRDADTASMRAFAEGYGLGADAMRWFWAQYGAPADEPLASPLLAASLADLPPALVVTAGCDILRDEAEAYARRLQAAGVPVTLRRYEGMMHGFLAHAGVLDRARNALRELGAEIRARVEVAA
jgi:acetyl esterase